MVNGGVTRIARFAGRAIALRWHLAILMAGVLVPAILLFGAAVLTLSQQEQRISEQRLLQSARDLAGLLDRENSASIRALLALAESAALDEDNLEAFHVEAGRVSKTQPSWRDVLLHAPDGTTLVSARTPWGEPLAPALDPHSRREALASRLPVVGRLVYDGQMWRFPINVPVIRGTEVKYVLSAVITASALGDLVATPFLGGEWTRVIIDQNGTIAARTREADRLVGRQPRADQLELMVANDESIARTRSLEGEDVFWAFSKARSSGWSAHATVAASEVLGSARRSIAVIAGAGALLLAGAVVGAILLTRRFSRAITSAAAGAELLARGERPAVEPTSVLEVAALARSLERSADLLAEKHRESEAHLAHAEAARAIAEEASQGKDQFLAMLGHELRNPLVPIRNGIYVLRRLVPPAPKTDKMLAMMDRQVVHIARMVDDLLDISRISQGKIILRKDVLELRALVREVFEDFRANAEDPSISLRLSLPEYPVLVEADKTRLVQCIYNLLHNAAKFTPGGGHIELSLSVRAGCAVLDLADTGLGIEPAMLPRLFEPFAQGPQALDRRKGGLGLGLALVKGLVEAHGGEISAYSEGQGKGARFVLTLPLAAKPAERPPASASGEPGAVQRVLIVEDSPDARESLRMMLELEGHQVKTACDAREALKVAPPYRPTVVLCDIGLPEQDGYELCRKLRTVPALEHTLFIAITGYGQERDVRRAYAAGFAVHLTKPVEPGVLQDVLALATG